MIPTEIVQSPTDSRYYEMAKGGNRYIICRDAGGWRAVLYGKRGSEWPIVTIREKTLQAVADVINSIETGG
jgi:hypothetical protein